MKNLWYVLGAIVFCACSDGTAGEAASNERAVHVRGLIQKGPFAVGSSIQVALFVAPVLVFASMLMNPGHQLDLHFSPMETVAVVLSVGVLALVSQDGESHWFEGAMLLGVYLLFALAFYHLPEAAP